MGSPLQSTSHEQQDSESEQSEAEDSDSEADEQHEVRRSDRQRTRNQRYFNSAFVNSAQVEGSISNNPPIPSTVKEALEGPNADDWRAAIAEELQHHAEQSSYRLKLRLPGKHTVPSMFIFTVKRDEHGNVVKFKARLVIKGCAQKYGRDYLETFSPVCCTTTQRTLLSVAAGKDWHVEQLDVTAAFLYGELQEETYMEYPRGFPLGPPDKVCRVQKAIYGLKQAPRAWYSKLRTVLEGIGFAASVADPGLFVISKGQVRTFLLVHVDDMLVVGPDMDQISRVKQLLAQQFVIKDLGAAKCYLGMEISRDRANRTLLLSQYRYTQELLQKFSMQDVKPALVPMSTAIKLRKEPSEDSEYMDMSTSRFAELVGGLMYLATHSRPDISHAVGALARYMANPTLEHWAAAQTVLKYLAGTARLGIKYSGSGDADADFVGFADANHGADLDTRRSTTGFAFRLYGGVISWSSRLQPTVAVSTAEAEYMAASAAIKEGLWLKQLLPELGLPIRAIPLCMDNQGAMKILKHPAAAQRSKHIDIIHHFAKERVQRGEVLLQYISTADMAADGLTKALDKAKMQFCRSAMGLVSC